ncbi:MAG: hypothetical protein AB7J40_01380 [Candidatus Altimarinota bacterium]
MEKPPINSNPTNRDSPALPIEPMLPESSPEPFDRKHWYFEMKWDGYRAIAHRDSKKIRLYSMNGVSFNDRFYPIIQALESISSDVILDGELVVSDEAGKTSFDILQKYLETGCGTPVYYVFDILFANQCDLRHLPLRRRKEILKKVLPENIFELKYVDHIQEKGRSLFQQAVENKWKGIIAKDSASTYQTGKRSPDWKSIDILSQKDHPTASPQKPPVPQRHRLTYDHAGKILWPEEQYTKEDLLKYYEVMGPYMLPYLKDRPESLHRYPNGIYEKHITQKEVHHLLPDWLQTVSLYTQSGNKTLRYPLCQNLDALLYWINLGCIDLNPWNSRCIKPDFPDYLILEIEAQGVSFKTVVQVALATHDLLEKARIKNLCKTSGTDSLHICIPLEGKYHYEQVRDVGFLINTMVHQKLPTITSLDLKHGKREKKVYLDSLQNRRGQTIASAYSVRPRPGAPVSAPLRWEELTLNLNPRQFHMKNMPVRIKKIGDLWEDSLGKGIESEESIKRLERLMKKGW